MSGRFEGQVAVVTGGANGIGRACVERFAAEGARVVVADLQPDRGKEVVDAIGADRALFVELDAADRDANVAMADTTLRTFGRIDILVTAAGISHAGYSSGNLEADALYHLGQLALQEELGAQFLAVDPAAWHKVLEVNLTGTFHAMQACAAPMVEQRRGSIVTIASIAAKDPDAGPLPYTVSKAGVWMLTKKAARLLGPAGVRVNAIGPGFIDTNMTKIIELVPEERQAELLARIPLARRGRPEEVAAVAAFLCSDDASYLTGELLHPDGGWYTD